MASDYSHIHAKPYPGWDVNERKFFDFLNEVNICGWLMQLSSKLDFAFEMRKLAAIRYDVQTWQMHDPLHVNFQRMACCSKEFDIFVSHILSFYSLPEKERTEIAHTFVEFSEMAVINHKWTHVIMPMLVHMTNGRNILKSKIAYIPSLVSRCATAENLPLYRLQWKLHNVLTYQHGFHTTREKKLFHFF